MSKANTWEDGLLALLFNNTAFTLVGDASGLPAAATEGNLYVSLHTSDPGEGGDQSTNETVYTNYARVAVPRNNGGSGWATPSAGTSNQATITFPTCGVTGATVTHVGIGTSVSGAGKLLYSAALSSGLAVSNGVTPQFAAGALTVAED